MTNPALKNRRSRPDLGQLREDGQHDSLYRQAERTRLERQFPGSFDSVGHDACGILCKIRKTGEATHGNVVRALEELAHMAHRSGEVRGEGDGAGIQTDIPRLLWKRWYEEAQLSPDSVDAPEFFVAHLFVPQGLNVREIQDALRVTSPRYGVQVKLERVGQVYSRALGPVARLTEPQFVQLSGTVQGDTSRERNRQLFELGLELEAHHPVHVVSLSTHSVVYKVRGSAELLPRYYPDLSHPEFVSVCTIGRFLGFSRWLVNPIASFG